MECLCSGKKKNPSMYRRPSELGLATTPMEDKTEIKRNFQPVTQGRQHIVKPIPDHKVTANNINGFNKVFYLQVIDVNIRPQETYHAAVEEWQEEEDKDTESTSHYKDLQAKRPVCNRIADHLTLGVSSTFINFKSFSVVP